MIGQKKLLKELDVLIQNNMFPHFSIIVGEKGSGKKELVKELSNKLNLPLYVVDTNMEDIREMLKQKTAGVYALYDVDSMSVNAKNAVLKTFENPHRNCYYVVTAEDEDNLLLTWKSRGTIFHLRSYSKNEILEYFTNKYNGIEEFEPYEILWYASTPYMVDKLVEYGKEFLNYVDLVIDNIVDVESANAFKSGSRLALKNKEGYDLSIFLHVTACKLFKRFKQTDNSKYLKMLKVTLKSQDKLRRTGANKQMVYDYWVLTIRSVGRD